MDHTSLKVDATALRVEGAAGQFILIYNVNIPVGQFGRPEVADRVCRILDRDFAGAETYYQLTATYFLENRATGKEIFWSGSFFPLGNSRGAPEPAFKRYHRDVLRPELLGSPEDALTWFEFEGLETDWVISRLTSVIVNVNGTVSEENAALRRWDLLRGRRGHVRRNAQFLLP